MEEIQGMEPAKKTNWSDYPQQMREIEHKGKKLIYCAVMQRKLNSIHVLREDGIISDKEYYILRHRIMRAANETPPLYTEGEV